MWLLNFPLMAGNLTVRFTSDGSERRTGFVATMASLCFGGTYSPTGRPLNGSCSGVCSAGYACPAGSTNGTVQVCLAGTYSVGGSASCTPCPGGRFGNATLLTASTCSGACTAGYACPTGSTNGTAQVCPAGTYSLAGSASCVTCPTGTVAGSDSCSTFFMDNK